MPRFFALDGVPFSIPISSGKFGPRATRSKPLNVSSELVASVTILLMSNPQREIEQRAKAVFERSVALDDTAKPRAQKLQFPPRAFDLVGLRVAPHHDAGTLKRR
jgi:hypothetical protein